MLAQTNHRSDDAGKLANQLELLRDALPLPEVHPLADDCGGPEAVADIEACVPSLRATLPPKRGNTGTPIETEYLDLLDGIIVEQARKARRAARSAARKLGSPALAKEFEMTALYESSTPAAADEPEPSTPSDETTPQT